MLIVVLFLVLLGSPTFAAHDFDGTDDIALNTTTSPVSTHPYTQACMFQPDAGNGFLMGVADGENLIGLGDVVFVNGTPAFAARSLDGVSASDANSTLTLTLSTTWYSVVGVYNTDTDRTAYTDGANSANNTTSRNSDVGLDSFSIGNLETNGSPTAGTFFNGRIAECAIYDAALVAADINALGKKFAPSCVRRSALVVYYPMVRDTTSLKDHAGDALNLTLTGTTVTEHAPVIRCDE